jgi:soluble lytic murein transglycosylase
MLYGAVMAILAGLAAASVSLRAGGPLVDVGARAAARVSADPDVVRRATESVRAGLEHTRADRSQAAADAYADAAATLPAFESWAAMLSAQAAARVGDTAAVQQHLARSDTSLVREWGWRARVEGALVSGDTAGAIRIAEQAAPKIRDAGRRADAWMRVGTLHARKDRTTAARTALRLAIDASSGSDASLEAAHTLAELGRPTQADQRRISRVYLRHGHYEQAAAAIVAYVEAGGVTIAERTALQLDLGRALFNARQYAAAEGRLRRATQIAGNNENARKSAADATYLLARTQNRRGRAADARATFVRVTKRFAGTTAAARAHFNIADIDHEEGRLESARTHYRATISARGPDAALAAVRLGSMALLAGEPRQAARVFRNAYGQVKDDLDRQQTGYWWARALTRAGVRDSAQLVLAEVQKINPFSYYGLRAAELRDSSPWNQTAADTAVTPVTPAVRERIARRVDVIDVLRGAGLSEIAAFETSRVLSRYRDVAGARYALGAEFHEHEMTQHGISIGRDLLNEAGWNRAILELVYPFPYRDAITASARANGLDPFLVAALIRQESMFNPRARSVVGAVGLMQLMPATGARLSRSLGLGTVSAAQLTDPSINLRLGTRFLADQIRGHDGRLVDAIAAYNAGPHRVERWRAFPEHRESELFAERIPYEETRDYVRIVQQNARIYRALYGGAQTD